MPWVLASKCSSHGRSTAFPSAVGRVPPIGVDRRVGHGAIVRTEMGLTSLAAGRADLRGRASHPRASPA